MNETPTNPAKHFLDPQALPPARGEQVDHFTHVLREEGGPTKENLVLMAFGYASSAIDHFQRRQIETGNLPLTDQQEQILVMLATDCMVAGAKQGAIQSKTGQDVTDWATITEQEATAIAFRQFELMFCNEKTRNKED